MGHRFDWIHPGAIAISPHELLDKLIAKAIEYEVIEKGHCKRVGNRRSHSGSSSKMGNGLTVRRSIAHTPKTRLKYSS